MGDLHPTLNSESLFSLRACGCHLKTLLDKLAACPYNSIDMCHSAAERRIPSPVSVGQMFMHLIMNRWSKLSLLTSILSG